MSATGPDGISARDKRLAEICVQCPVCRYARAKQRGLIFGFVKTIEGSICPACRAYERVYGRRAHEAVQ